MPKRDKRQVAIVITVVIVAAVVISLVVIFSDNSRWQDKGDSFPPGTCNSTKCFIENAVKRKDPTICGNIDNNTVEMDCYRNVTQVAVENKNQKICERVGEKDIKNGCIAAVAAAGGGGGSTGSSQPDLSCSLSGPMYQHCLLQFARETLNPAFCSIIQDENERDRCFIILAVMNYDESLCNQVSNADRVEICHLYMTREFIPYNETG